MGNGKSGLKKKKTVNGFELINNPAEDTDKYTVFDSYTGSKNGLQILIYLIQQNMKAC